MKEPLKKQYLLVAVIAISVIFIAVAIVVSQDTPPQQEYNSHSILHASDVLPEKSDFNKEVELHYGHFEDWENTVDSMNGPLWQAAMMGYSPEDQQNIERMNQDWSHEVAELLDHEVIDYAVVSYMLYDDSGQISDVTSAEIYAFNDTEGAEWYFGEMISGACDEEKCLYNFEGPWDVAIAPSYMDGGSNIYYVRSSNIVFKTFSTDKGLSIEMAGNIAERASGL